MKCSVNLKVMCILRRSKQMSKSEPGKGFNNAFSNSQIDCTPIISLFCKKNKYLKIQKTNHKTLRVVFISYESCDELL